MQKSTEDIVQRKFADYLSLIRSLGAKPESLCVPQQSQWNEFVMKALRHFYVQSKVMLE